MVEIGGRPILWHIMKIYAPSRHQRLRRLPRLQGLRIKEYFANYFLHMSDVTFDLAANTHGGASAAHAEPWRVTLVDTGDARRRPAGGCKRVARYLGDETVLPDLRRRRRGRRHRRARAISIAAHGRVGDRDRGAPARPLRRARASTAIACSGFEEKPAGDGGWINGGFFVLSPRGARLHRRRRRPSGSTSPSSASRARASWRLSATTASGSRWTRCATRIDLEELWAGGKAPWKVWRVTDRAAFWRGRRVLVTGHTGFKGGWLCALAARAWGRRSTGYALDPPTRARASSRPRAWARCSRTIAATSATRPPRAARSKRSIPRSSSTSPRSSIVTEGYRDAGRHLRRPTSSAPRTCSRPCAPRAVAARRSSSSPPTSATRTVSGTAATRDRRARRPRPVQQQQGVRRAGERRVPALVFRRARTHGGPRHRARGQRHRRRRLGGRSTSSRTSYAPRWRAPRR